MESCGCPSSARCPRCVDALVAQLSGTAENRGWFQAERIAGARIGGRWRTSKAEALAIARELLVDLEDLDEGVIAKLADAVGKGAAARWRSTRS